MSSTDRVFDCIVLGVGGVGSAALEQLARRGAKVLGIDRFPPGHDQGSSHGHTRVIRLAYHEHADYVPLLHRAYALWEELESRSGTRLYVRTGILESGPRHGEVVSGVLQAAQQHALEVEELTAADIRQRFPGLRVPEHWVGVFEAHGGFLFVEAAVQAQANVAVQHGAQLRIGEVVQRWESVGDDVVVVTDRDTYRAARLVITAGAWAPQLLQALGLSLTVLRKPLLWYRTTTADYRLENGFPVWLFETPAGIIYGFPEIDARGLKVAEHTGGLPVDDPLHVDRGLTPADRAPIEAFLPDYLPGVSQECLRHVVCMYTMTPDQHFIVDHHPHAPQVCFVAGLSGHGFKFATVLGEVLADLALNGTTTLPVGFLGLRRPGLSRQVPV